MMRTTHRVSDSEKAGSGDPLILRRLSGAVQDAALAGQSDWEGAESVSTVVDSSGNDSRIVQGSRYYAPHDDRFSTAL